MGGTVGGIPPSQHPGAPSLIGLVDAFFAREKYMLNHNTELAQCIGLLGR
jgi:hypothetical protein